MFYWVANNSKFPTNKWRFDKTDPTVLLLCSCVVCIRSKHRESDLQCKIPQDYDVTAITSYRDKPTKKTKMLIKCKIFLDAL